MSPTDHEFLAAPLWIITSLHVLTLTLHFMAMNFLLGGAIIVAQAALRGRGPDPFMARMTRLLPAAMATTVTLGVAPLLFVQLVYHRQLYAAAIVSGWFWLLVIPAALVAYYALYFISFKSRGNSPGSKHEARLAWLIPLAGFFYISFLYSSIFSMVEKPDQIHALYASNQSGWVFNPALDRYGWRWLHMVFGAVAVGGFFTAWLGRNDEKSFATGRAFFIGGTIAAALAGAGHVMALQPYFAALKSSPAMSALAIGILLSAAAVYFFLDREFLYAGFLLFGSMLSMVYTRHTVRQARLAPAFDPASLRVQPQWLPFTLFLIFFVIAAAVLAWMIRHFLRAAGKTPA